MIILEEQWAVIYLVLYIYIIYQTESGLFLMRKEYMFAQTRNPVGEDKGYYQGVMQKVIFVVQGKLKPWSKTRCKSKKAYRNRGSTLTATFSVIVM